MNVPTKKERKKEGGGVGEGVVQKEQPRLSLTTLIRLAKNKRVGWVGKGGVGRTQGRLLKILLWGPWVNDSFSMPHQHPALCFQTRKQKGSHTEYTYCTKIAPYPV